MTISKNIVSIFLSHNKILSNYNNCVNEKKVCEIMFCKYITSCFKNTVDKHLCAIVFLFKITITGGSQTSSWILPFAETFLAAS